MHSTGLQITNYNFPETPDHPDNCVGIVKGNMLHQKNPSQHMVDLNMLERTDWYQHLFQEKEVWLLFKDLWEIKEHWEDTLQNQSTWTTSFYNWYVRKCACSIQISCAAWQIRNVYLHQDFPQNISGASMERVTLQKIWLRSSKGIVFWGTLVNIMWKEWRAIMKYLIGQNFGGQNFRWTQFFGRQNFPHNLEISAVVSAEILSDKVFHYCSSFFSHYVD